MAEETPTRTTRRRTERLSSRYQRAAVEWLVVILFGGLIAAVLGVAAAVVYWAWQ